MSNSLKLLLMSTATIITCVIICIANDFLKRSKSLGQVASNQLLEYQTKIEEDTYLSYDGLVVTGADVVSFMKKELGAVNKGEASKITIIVTNSKNPTSSYSYSNKEYIKEVQDCSSLRYIKPIHFYRGSVKRNTNGCITSIEFVKES